MTGHQKNHKQLRANHLESLAEAVVLHRSPNLSHDSMAGIKQERTEQYLKEIIQREKKRQAHQKINFTLNPSQSSGLRSVDIPDASAKGPNLGSPDNPKTWKGPWITLTKPHEIASVIKDMNIKQYNQAFLTPFGSGPLADSIGRKGDTQPASELLQGRLPTHLLEDLLPETVNILHTLARQHPQTLNSNTLVSITDDEFISAYKMTKEATSSSPSGRHVGHYKAILDDTTLVSLHATMMSLPR